MPLRDTKRRRLRALLWDNPGVVVERAIVFERLYGPKVPPGAKPSVRSMVNRLRLDAARRNARIVAVRGVGWLFVPEGRP